VRAPQFAAVVHAAVTAGIVAFQCALAAGAPWGRYAMGGAFPGAFPTPLRVAALVQAAVLVAATLVVLARAGVAMPAWARASRLTIWFVVALSAVSLVLNTITPSAGERAIWAPVAAVMLVSVLVVAIQRRAVGAE